ncbi:ATP-dependent DNA helicase RecQ [Amycolatopsis sp. K13G38]|uniref:ATP-dependent DNA helicase RecQ n=1 Tax=Amycolatopsis acididurans TaxID=2724524 RepID=A0ABX1JG71_9PSEU|nr:ATP-dependent DNA helicase RecQ [Amycolatopsis acididurans]NKQ57415.1 ATP-dependent DNA helicase RecQ [Amycolatopsis acididurans]
MSTIEQLREAARKTFGWSDLRPEQLTAMEQLIDGHDVLVVMPTGSGKSAIYQVPALLLRGPTLVVSPLTALQRDQVGQIEDSRAPEAVAVNSAQRAGESDRAWDAVSEGEAEYLFLSPEQLAKDEVLEQVAEAAPSLFVIDEAHCVSAWGHDFRPDYLRLGHVIEQLGHPRVLALTATAGAPVRDDIVRYLGMRDPARVVTGFDRPNLHLAVRQAGTDEDKRDAVLDWVRSAAKPGLVYTATRKDTGRYAEALGERTAAYHAGMKPSERERVHEQFLAGNLDVVIATSAFGMGIDKPDVRFVVHASVPESLDSYYQQIGRAGRDGEPAEAVLFYRPEDLGLQKFLTSRPLDTEGVREVAGVVEDHEGPASPREIDEAVAQSHRRAMNNLNLLEQAEVIRARGGRFAYEGGEPVEAATEIARRRKDLARSRIEVMREYAETRSCRRQFLLGYFGEVADEPCGHCDTCEAGVAEEHAPEPGGPFAAGSVVRHREWGPGQVVRRDAERLTVLFDEAGYRTLSVRAVESGGLLTEEANQLITPAGGQGASRPRPNSS